MDGPALQIVRRLKMLFEIVGANCVELMFSFPAKAIEDFKAISKYL